MTSVWRCGAVLGLLALASLSVAAGPDPAERATTPAVPSNNLEDYYGPVGKDWAAELGFLVVEATGKQSGRSYGMGVDDMVIEWVETHPIAQTGAHCTTVGNPYFENNGQCASIALGATNIAGVGDLEIPVSVVDPIPGAQLGECTIDGSAGVYVRAYSGVDPTGELYCLKPTAPGSTEFKGVVRATTRINIPGDGYVYTAYDAARTPAITISYFDKYDGTGPGPSPSCPSCTGHDFGAGPDGKPGIANLDDDNNATGPACGAIADCGSAPAGGCANQGGLCCPGANVTGCDTIEEQCGEGTSFAAGRTPHFMDTPARWSDDTCGCPDNPVSRTVALSYNAMDLVLSDVRVRDGWGGVGVGDGDGFPDPKERVILDVRVRNMSDFPVENVELTLSPTKGPIECLWSDRLTIPRLEKHGVSGDEWDTFDHAPHFVFIPGGAPTFPGRVNPADDYSSEWTLSVRALGKATPGVLATDIPIDGTAVVQRFKLQHNLDAVGGGRAVDWVEDFESYSNDNSVFCTPAAGSSRCTTAPYIRRNTGDAPGELIGTRCQANNPSNPYGNDTQPEDFCQLGEGYSNTENHWHLDAPDDSSGGPTCERTGAGACVDQGRSHGPGSNAINSGMYKGTDLTGGDNNVGSIWNRMYWFKTRDSRQLGIGKVLHADIVNDRPLACTRTSCPSAAANQAPVLEQWVQISTLDWRIFSNVPEGVVMDAAMTYVCVDKNNNGDCDTAEDGIPSTCAQSGFACSSNATCCSNNCSANLCTGPSQYNSEHWDVLRSYYSPEQGYRLNNWINCMYDPSDDGNSESDFFVGAVTIGPSSTCYPQTVDSCVGLTDDDFRGGLRVREGPSCWPETGVLNGEGQTGPAGGGIGFGTWIKRLYNLKPYRGQNVLFRWHVSPGGLSGLPDSTPYSLFNRDDGWYLDDIHLYGRASGLTLVPDNSDFNPPQNCNTPAPVFFPRLAAIDYPRSNPDSTPKPASACSDSDVAYCDFDADGTVDAAGPVAQSVGPGHPYVMEGRWTSATYCLRGTLEFRFEDSTGAVIRDWLTDPETYVAPVNTTAYRLLVRCTADPTLIADTSVVVNTCQNTVDVDVTAAGGPDNLTWRGPGVQWDLVRGSITDDYTDDSPPSRNAPTCLQDNSPHSWSTDDGLPGTTGPAHVEVFYYLVKEHGPEYTYSEGFTCGGVSRDDWAPRTTCAP